MPNSTNELPLPPHYKPDQVGEVWKVRYEELARLAHGWADRHGLRPASEDQRRVALIGVDVQNTFCIPGFELYVGGRTGTGAVDDTRRLTEFIYRNLGRITLISATMDTHQAMQIFHAVFLIDSEGRHPDPMTLVTAEDVQTGRWKFNPEVAGSLGISPEYGQEHLEHYTRQLQHLGKYELTIWPYHSMLGGIGHALVASFEEALFFHTLTRQSQSEIVIKGFNPLTESYSAIGPEVLTGPQGRQIGEKNESFLEKLLGFDAVIVAGQAKSHCVAWTMDDLLQEIRTGDPSRAGKIYLLEDCSSPVVVPGVVDYTEQADAAYRKFAKAGMHVVKSTDPVDEWPDFPA